jgi:hypothetical protein
MSYRFARRSFMSALGGAFGLKIMLRNLEASAQGAPPPPRLLVAFWPLGTVKYFFVPSAPGTDYLVSRILRPFEDAGLRNDMSILYGLQTSTIQGMGGGAEGGTVKAVTGANSPGNRANGGESDDAVAGGPSFDQIFLKNVPELQRPGVGYANAICDARVDSFETSSQCLSYGYATRSIAASRGGTDGMVTENVPLMPSLRPYHLYTSLFAGFMPHPSSVRLTNVLRARKSVLDHSARELARLRTLAPASERSKIDAHADAIRKMETSLSTAINGPVATRACLAPPPNPDPLAQGESGSSYEYTSQPRAVSRVDDPLLERLGKLHMNVIRAAFQCDIIRVATFQWAPATNHIAFAGLYPPDPGGSYVHHPMSHHITNRSDTVGSYPTDSVRQGVVDFLTNVQTWYNQKTADILHDWKSAQDVFGGNLLDNTIVPFVTDKAEATDSGTPMPALIFGGRALGMIGGQYLNFESRPRPHNDLWMTIAQAYLRTTDPVARLQNEVFVKTNVAPIPGLWARPG